MILWLSQHETGSSNSKTDVYRTFGEQIWYEIIGIAAKIKPPELHTDTTKRVLEAMIRAISMVAGQGRTMTNDCNKLSPVLVLSIWKHRNTGFNNGDFWACWCFTPLFCWHYSHSNQIITPNRMSCNRFMQILENSFKQLSFYNVNYFNSHSINSKYVLNLTNKANISDFS